MSYAGLCIYRCPGCVGYDDLIKFGWNDGMIEVFFKFDMIKVMKYKERNKAGIPMEEK